jgi:uncharacterized membrane protein (UPF0127 family)
MAALAVLSLGGAGCAARSEPERSAEQPQSLAMESVTIRTAQGSKVIRAQVADTPERREIGLMYRKQMADDEGMIFDFQEPQSLAFWMRNTLIPLDIIFIDERGRVINIVANARPMDETPLPSSAPALAVLEINGGLASKLGIHPGDVVVDSRIFRH